jgi:hypothetical protein
MTNSIINIPTNTQSLPSTAYFFISPKNKIETNSNIFSYFQKIVTFGFEPVDAITNFNSANNVLQIIDNNYLSIFLRKLTYNSEIYSSIGTIINKANWNYIFDLTEIDNSDSENNGSIIELSLVNIERLSEIHSFLTHLKTKDNELDEITGMKEIILKIDDLIDNKDFNLIDNMITSFISLDFSFQFNVSLIACTLVIKEHLSNRIKLFENAKLLSRNLMSEDELQLTLQGLE